MHRTTHPKRKETAMHGFAHDVRRAFSVGLLVIGGAGLLGVAAPGNVHTPPAPKLTVPAAELALPMIPRPNLV